MAQEKKWPKRRVENPGPTDQMRARGNVGPAATPEGKKAAAARAKKKAKAKAAATGSATAAVTTAGKESGK